MAAAFAVSKGAALAAGPWTGITKRSSSSTLHCLPGRPLRAVRSLYPKCSGPKQAFRAGLEVSNRQRECVVKAPGASDVMNGADVEATLGSSSGLPAGLTISSAVCLLELFATGVAEAAHAPQVNAGEFFTSLTVDGLIEWVLTVGAFIVFYFLVAPPVLLTYFLRRWKKKQLGETLFMFALVFVFFPGLMVWAPFINTRPIPRTVGRYTAETDKAAFRGDEWR